MTCNEKEAVQKAASFSYKIFLAFCKPDVCQIEYDLFIGTISERRGLMSDSRSGQECTGRI
jgi:hypothetical protein